MRLEAHVCSCLKGAAAVVCEVEADVFLVSYDMFDSAYLVAPGHTEAGEKSSRARMNRRNCSLRQMRVPRGDGPSPLGWRRDQDGREVLCGVSQNNRTLNCLRENLELSPAV